jgi:hypothetical protein
MEDKKKAEILNHLMMSGEYLTAKSLANLVDLPQTASCRQVRELITELIEEDHEPIIANEQGFKYTNDSDELVAYAKSLMERKRGLDKRIEAVRFIAADRGIEFY